MWGHRIRNLHLIYSRFVWVKACQDYHCLATSCSSPPNSSPQTESEWLRSPKKQISKETQSSEELLVLVSATSKRFGLPSAYSSYTRSIHPPIATVALLSGMCLPAHLLQRQRGEQDRGYYEGATHRTSGSMAPWREKKKKHWTSLTANLQHGLHLNPSVHWIYKGKFSFSLAWRAGNPFSPCNKMSVDAAPTAAKPLYLVCFKTHIQVGLNIRI